MKPSLPGIEVTEQVPQLNAPVILGLEVTEWVLDAYAEVGASETSTEDVSTPLRMVDHGWRRGCGGSRRMRGNYWSDWQVEEGAAMDAPTLWHPQGSTRATCHMEGTDNTYALRSGYVWMGDMDPSVQFVFPEVRGRRYRCRLERGRLAEARAEQAGARRLRSGSTLWYEVEAAAWTEAA